MKRVKVDSLQPPADTHSAIVARTLYEVPLGNHVVVRFSSKRQALAWQADATRQLTDMLLSCNLMLVEVFTAYRMAWPYFDAGDALQPLVRDAEAALERAAKVGGPNAIFHRWRALSEALRCMRQMAMELVKVYMVKSHAVPRHQCQVLAERCGELLTALDHFGTDVDRAKGYRPAP